MFEDKKWDKTFKNRLAKHYDELKWLYSELYHNDQQAFDYFCDMMYDYYEKRSPMLREWDEAREASPDWYKGNDMLGMLMYTNCFAGNLKGVTLSLTSARFSPNWVLWKTWLSWRTTATPAECAYVSTSS